MDFLPSNDDQSILVPKQTLENAISKVNSDFTAQDMSCPTKVVLGALEIHTKSEPDVPMDCLPSIDEQPILLHKPTLEDEINKVESEFTAQDLSCPPRVVLGAQEIHTKSEPDTPMDFLLSNDDQPILSSKQTLEGSISKVDSDFAEQEMSCPTNVLGAPEILTKSESDAPMDFLPNNDDQPILLSKQTLENAISKVDSDFAAQDLSCPTKVVLGAEIHTKSEPDGREKQSQEHVGENSNNRKKEKSSDISASDENNVILDNKDKPILCVVYLPFDWSVKQIKDFIEEECGPVIRCNVGKDTKLDIPGVISAEFETMEQCVKAKEILHKKKVEGMKLHAYHISDVNTTIESDTDSEPSETRARPKKRRRQKSVEDASIDVWGTDPTGLYGLKPKYLKSLNVTPPITRWIHVSNFRCDKWELKEALEMAGKVVACRVVHTAKKHANVMYSHPLEAIQAISMLHNQKFYGAALHITMDHLASPLVSMPNGLTAIGPGLGNFGKPLSDVVKHYERYLNGYSSSVNRTVFRKRKDIKADFLNNEGLPVTNYYSIFYADSPRSGSTHQIPGPNIYINPTPFFSESPANLSAPAQIAPELTNVSSDPTKNDLESHNVFSNSESSNGSPISIHSGPESRKVSPNLSSNDPVPQNVASNSTQNDPESLSVSSNSSSNTSESRNVLHTSTQNIPGQSNLLSNPTQINVGAQNFWSNPTQTVPGPPNVWSNQPQNTPGTPWPNPSQNNPGNPRFNHIQNLTVIRPQRVAFIKVQNSYPQQPFHQNFPRQAVVQTPQFRQISGPQFQGTGPPQFQGTGPQFQGTRHPFTQGTGPQFGQAVGSGTRPPIGQGTGPQFRAMGPQFSQTVGNTLGQGTSPQFQGTGPQFGQGAAGSRMAFGQQAPVNTPAACQAINLSASHETKPEVLVHLSNLPLSTPFMQLCEKMNLCGPVTSLRLTDPGSAIVQFSQRSCAEKCFQLYNNCCVNGNIIKVTIV